MSNTLESRPAPSPGTAFHVPGSDDADVRTVAQVLTHVAQYPDGEDGWLVRTHRGDFFVLTRSSALDELGIRFAGRRAVAP